MNKMIFVIIIGVLAGIDLIIKYGIEKLPDINFPRPFKYAKEKITIHKFHNSGFPFGFMKKYPQIIRSIPLIITSGILGVFSYLLPKKGNIVLKTGLAIILGGSISNLYDRFIRKYVVDYFSINIKPIKKVIFNLGDIFIFLGSIILTIRTLCIDAGDIIRNIKNSLSVFMAGTGRNS